MIEKKDYETALKQYENANSNSEFNIELNNVCIEYIKKKISEFPVEEEKKVDNDPMPEEVKELVNAA